MEEIFLGMVGLIGVLLVFGLTAMILQRKQDAENRAQPIKHEMAKLIDMQRIDSGGIIIGEIWGLFETEGGQRIRLYAKLENSLVVGDVGMLTWQGQKILTFERKNITEGKLPV